MLEYSLFHIGCFVVYVIFLKIASDGKVVDALEDPVLLGMGFILAPLSMCVAFVPVIGVILLAIPKMIGALISGRPEKEGTIRF